MGISVNVNGNRFVIFNDLLQLIPMLSQTIANLTESNHKPMADSVCLIVMLLHKTWPLSSKQLLQLSPLNILG